MENLVLELFKDFNYSQSILFITIAIIFYYKIKNAFNQKTDELKYELSKQINGLGSRFDSQFGEFKDKNAEAINDLSGRVYKLEIETSLINQSKDLIEKINGLLMQNKIS